MFAPPQVFEEKDYRNVRFQNSTRLVNENWGINLIAEIPPQECTERVVACDGGDGPLGHPKVYINLVSGWTVMHGTGIYTFNNRCTFPNMRRTSRAIIRADTAACGS